MYLNYSEVKFSVLAPEVTHCTDQGEI